MKSRAFLVPIVIVVVVISASLSVAFWRFQVSQSQRDKLEEDLESLAESYKAGEVEVMDLSTITPVVWDKLYLFGPYTTKQHIVEITGLGTSRALPGTIESSDSIVLFVFIHKDKIVQYMGFPRNPDFDYAVRESAYGPSDAIFVLDERDRALPYSP